MVSLILILLSIVILSIFSIVGVVLSVLGLSAKKKTGSVNAKLVVGGIGSFAGGIAVFTVIFIGALIMPAILSSEDTATDNNGRFDRYGVAEGIVNIAGVDYVCNRTQQVAINDHKLGSAFATITDGDESLTVYKYNSSSGCDLVCIKKSVYCPVSQVDDFLRYYSDANMTYTKRYYKRKIGKRLGNSSGLKNETVFFSDELFQKLVTGDPDCTELTEKRDAETSHFELTQKSSDGELVRKIKVVYTKDGVRIDVLQDPFYLYTSGNATYPAYKVTDSKAIRELKMYK